MRWWRRHLHGSNTPFQGFAQDTWISRARHKPVYLEPLVMSSQVGERMSGRDFMPLSST
jgi:hypothetical protein